MWITGIVVDSPLQRLLGYKAMQYQNHLIAKLNDVNIKNKFVNKMIEREIILQSLVGIFFQSFLFSSGFTTLLAA